MKKKKLEIGGLIPVAKLVTLAVISVMLSCCKLPGVKLLGVTHLKDIVKGTVLSPDEKQIDSH